MLETNYEIQEVEITIEQAKESIKRSEALDRLIKNPDFVLLITEGYFVKQASRLALLSADANLPADNTVMEELKSIGHLNQYLTQIDRFGSMAKGSIVGYEETLEELQSEVDGE